MASVVLRLAVTSGLVAMLTATPVGTASADPTGVSLVAGDRFRPKEVTVRVGEQVVWTHRDGNVAHTVTADDGSFDSHPACTRATQSPCMREPDTFTQRFTRAGRFPYFCKIHGAPGGEGMAGVVVVRR